jgi:hypothetical protein
VTAPKTVSIVMPAFNEAAMIAAILARVRAAPWARPGRGRDRSPRAEMRELT